jgi:hypothetical protein
MNIINIKHILNDCLINHKNYETTDAYLQLENNHELKR